MKKTIITGALLWSISLALCSYDVPKGWIVSGNAINLYEMGTDKGSGQNGANAATIRSSVAKGNDFGTLMQQSLPDKYKGKRVRMTGYIKSANVTGGAGLWLRVDQKGTQVPLSFDNMQNRPVKGSSDWKQYEIVLEVPEKASNIAYGALLIGAGQIWFDNIRFEIVDQSVALTCAPPSAYDTPNDWLKAGDRPDQYDMGTDKGAGPKGRDVATLKSIAANIEGFGTLMQQTLPDKYLGKRVRMTGYMKSAGVAKWAGFWLRIDLPGEEVQPVFDNMQERPIKGTTDWKQYAVVLDVPENAKNMAWGALITGTGQIWFEKVEFEIVDKTVPSTAMKL